jgi:Tfp pilus assembly protein PilN
MYNIVDINLLPGKKRKRLSKENRQIITIGIILLLTIALFYGGLQYQIYNKNAHLQDVNNQIASLKNIEDTLNQRNQLGATVFSYENTIEKLVKSQITWNDLIVQLGNTMPKETFIETITADRAKNLITLSGHTTDLQKLAWTVNSIKSNENFSNVQVESYTIPLGVTVTKTGEPEYAMFVISFQWKEIKK